MRGDRVGHLAEKGAGRASPGQIGADWMNLVEFGVRENLMGIGVLGSNPVEMGAAR